MTERRKTVQEETGRYKIEVRFDGVEPRRYAALLLRDEYEGWSEFHCTFRGGALALYLLRKGSRWLSKDRRYTVLKVEMISREEYCGLLEEITGLPKAVRKAS